MKLHPFADFWGSFNIQIYCHVGRNMGDFSEKTKQNPLFLNQYVMLLFPK